MAFIAKGYYMKLSKIDCRILLTERIHFSDTVVVEEINMHFGSNHLL